MTQTVYVFQNMKTGSMGTRYHLYKDCGSGAGTDFHEYTIEEAIKEGYVSCLHCVERRKRETS